MADKKGSWRCCQCGKEFTALDFKIKSLLQPDQWVCEDCALYEDEVWIRSLNKNEKPETV